MQRYEIGAEVGCRERQLDELLLDSAEVVFGKKDQLQCADFGLKQFWRVRLDLEQVGHEPELFA